MHSLIVFVQWTHRFFGQMDVIRQALKMVHLVDWVMHNEIFIGNTNKIDFFFGMDTVIFSSQK